VHVKLDGHPEEFDRDIDWPNEEEIDYCGK